MSERTYHYRISPGVIKNDIFLNSYFFGNTEPNTSDDCCLITTPTTTQRILGYTYVYSSMTQIVSGGTNGSSLLTGLTIPILLTENTVDVGYYSAFDGMVSQQETFLNFIFTGSPIDPYRCIFYNTSDLEFKKYLSFSTFVVDWGDGNTETLTPNTTRYSHIYPNIGEYTITLRGNSPWGTNIVQKTINVPFTNYEIPNPNGIASFIPQGGSWSGTPLSYDYIFSGDSICDDDVQVTSNYEPVPFIVSGYTTSRIRDLQVYGPRRGLLNGLYSADTYVTGSSGVVGIVYNPPPNSNFISYEIDSIDYFDFTDGTTIFLVNSSGITEDMLVCSAITKNEALMNVAFETEIQSNIFIERGKNSALERIQRLGEVDNLGDLTKYGYKFFNIKTT